MQSATLPPLRKPCFSAESVERAGLCDSTAATADSPCAPTEVPSSRPGGAVQNARTPDPSVPVESPQRKPSIHPITGPAMPAEGPDRYRGAPVPRSARCPRTRRFEFGRDANRGPCGFARQWSMAPSPEIRPSRAPRTHGDDVLTSHGRTGSLGWDTFIARRVFQGIMGAGACAVPGDRL